MKLTPLTSLAYRVALAALVSSALIFGHAATASADEGSEAFVKAKHENLVKILKQAPSGAREGQVTAEMNTMVDYDALARRAFGDPCPIAGCDNHWANLTEAQRTEVRGLLQKLVEKNYKKNLVRLVDYQLTVKRSTDANGESKVRTEAKSVAKPREAATTIDYVVVKTGDAYHVVDIVTEGSSLAKNYYHDFNVMMKNDAQKYPFIVKRLNEKLAEH